jgi:hypothetical protein
VYSGQEPITLVASMIAASTSTRIPAASLHLGQRRRRVLPVRPTLDQLRNAEATVNELNETIGGSQQNVSKQSQLLADAGVVGRRKDGSHV